MHEKPMSASTPEDPCHRLYAWMSFVLGIVVGKGRGKGGHQFVYGGEVAKTTSDSINEHSAQIHADVATSKFPTCGPTERSSTKRPTDSPTWQHARKILAAESPRSSVRHWLIELLVVLATALTRQTWCPPPEANRKPERGATTKQPMDMRLRDCWPTSAAQTNPTTSQHMRLHASLPNGWGVPSLHLSQRCGPLRAPCVVLAGPTQTRSRAGSSGEGACHQRQCGGGSRKSRQVACANCAKGMVEA